MLYEFKDGLNQYLKASGSPHTSLEALIAFNKAHADAVMPYFGQELFERAQAKGPLSDAPYLKAREHAQRLAGKEGLLAALDRDRLDAIIAPSMSPAWLIDHVLGDHFLGAGYPIAAVAGTPSLTVPVGDVEGLPLGLTIMGREYSEADIIALAISRSEDPGGKPPRPATLGATKSLSNMCLLSLASASLPPRHMVGQTSSLYVSDETRQQTQFGAYRAKTLVWTRLANADTPAYE